MAEKPKEYTWVSPDGSQTRLLNERAAAVLVPGWKQAPKAAKKTRTKVAKESADDGSGGAS